MSVILVDRIGSIALHNGLLRVDCITAGRTTRNGLVALCSFREIGRLLFCSHSSARSKNSTSVCVSRRSKRQIP